ncbi:hypothetical protein AB4455_03530 [Vibrio sp. 10N.261.46.E12]|uniref:hypothetical protein n=1 Tax=unclassified Vibrio TaxID=2614977 RepID=UPI00097839D6|nr:MULTISPECIES: hypothetical protein [unclassified Vibrio]OMO38345.1 hypothetical protein BH584_01640 [Vibrio sp. 10N.261.45.E1]PMJ19530.1 hypothetical protein BCU27_21555 [Vibrio sp. 10N.286.45.B6]PML84276.1 hypothetical protein BCT66_17770 [Vibrio sp. 10N.261.49.E11]PMM79800.1 hypothetical protein BCT46_19605 [Vibrio sp. 10N.261.46.E8]PMN47536.1 hypothetical protein BCT32_09515 [Vibrio sp. 10N.261.45.E11]
MKISNPNLISRRLQFSFLKAYEEEVKSLTSSDISFIMNEVLRVKSEVEVKANRKLSISELMAFLSINALMAGQPDHCVKRPLSHHESGIRTEADTNDNEQICNIKSSTNTSTPSVSKEVEESITRHAIKAQCDTSQEHSVQEEPEDENLIDAGDLFGDKGLSAMFDFSQK